MQKSCVRAGRSLFEKLENRLLLTIATNGPEAAVFDTNMGAITVQLTPEITPATVANFLTYVNSGAYDKTIFHRLERNFVLQGGGYTVDPNNLLTHIQQNAPVVNEFHTSNTRGTIAMAKVGGDPNSATSEFFFNLADNSQNLDNQNGGFTVFGNVIQGYNVLDQANNLSTTSMHLTVDPTGQGIDNVPTVTPGANPTLFKINSVTAGPMTVVTIGNNAGGDKSVIFTDTDGTLCQVRVTSGTATLMFAGTNLEASSQKGLVRLVVKSGTDKGKPAPVTLTSIALTNTSAATKLIVATAPEGTKDKPKDPLLTGVSVGAVTSDHSIAQLVAPAATFSNGITINGSAKFVTINGLFDSTFDIKGKGGALSIGITQASNASLNSAMAVRDLVTRNWTANDPASPGDIKAPSIKFLNAPSGDFTPNVTISGEGSKTISFINMSNLVGGQWNINGNVKNLITSTSSKDFKATITGGVNRWSGTRIGGAWSVKSVNHISGYFLDHLDLTTTGSFSRGARTIGDVKLTGNIDNSVIHSSGNVGKLSMSGFDQSSLYVGVNPTIAGGTLPVAADFVAPATLFSMTLKKLPGTPTFNGAVIAASNIGVLNFPRINLANGGVPEGIVAHRIGRLNGAGNGGEDLSFVNLTSEDQVTSTLQKRGIATLKDFTITII